VIRITDRLLSLPLLEKCRAPDLRRLYRLLLDAGADYAEVSPGVLEKLGPAVQPGRTVLRLQAQALGAARTVRHGENGSGPQALFLPAQDEAPGARGALYEVRIQSARGFDPAYPFKRGLSYRISGLDDLLLYDYPPVLKRLRCRAGSPEFCPGNRFGCATALAWEWLQAGGQRIVSSFLGKGGLPALEELLMILHVSGQPKAEADFSALMELKRTYEEASGEKVDPHKSVLGDEIFHVESGVHVDGILKDPANYEPFPPELVGRRRVIRLGKHSGKGAIRHKLDAWGMAFSDEDTETLLQGVREKSQSLGRGITEEEFRLLAGGL
jgi:homocitrate synthase NifV